MVRGAEYDNGIPQSDNAIENGPNKAHGVGAADGPLDRKVAPMPAETGSGREVFSGQGSAGPTNSGSGKGGHEPKTLGQNKGTGAQGV
ncbi:uncharacterized protein N7469_010999 [Penicillium citrinum]|uniref:Uncharacterized protein n=2 Tax=Penicillium TaxID=5073 RepID=A0A9W9NLE7_PENCI|nr:uncharacterized protein N7469_010999 [Penicillium citrinum]KAJ5222112.1 hypothetical protein N7469_010999 [Penicillium citrinum]KAJ5597088.1 hypothetical protein N7450_003546 [Penicillium hetheringtonii]